MAGQARYANRENDPRVHATIARSGLSMHFALLALSRIRSIHYLCCHDSLFLFFLSGTRFSSIFSLCAVFIVFFEFWGSQFEFEINFDVLNYKI